MQLNEITKNNIIKIIKNKNMSIRSLGKKAPFSTNHIYKYLNGSRKISLETLDTLGDNTVTYGAFLILFFYVLPFLLFPLKPLNSILSRKHEFEADRYAAKTSEPKNLISALIKLYRENSAPVITNRWFSLFYDSHPNAKARIEALE